MNILNNHRLILGSQSPRRSQLLDELDLPFIKRPIDIDESYPDDLPTKDVAEYIARNKAEVHRSLLKKRDIVLTSDSVVAIGERILGKPNDKDKAIQFLNMLSDSIHQVYTGVCLLSPTRLISFTATANVKMSHLTQEEINFYLDKYNPYDKAGSYGIQEWLGHAKIEWIKGTFTNIMGLPTYNVYEALKGMCSEI